MDDFSFSDPPGQWTLPVANAGLPIIAASAFATLVLAILGFKVMAVIGLFWSFAVLGFFRDPDRAIPAGEDLIVSPADGKVIVVSPGSQNPFTKAEAQKISVFMSVFNVHVNRIPSSGRIVGTSYHPGKFVPADREAASLKNEQNALFLETENGIGFCVVQIAGLIARRIICHVQTGDRVKRGQRFGLICFGSRLDLYLPAAAQLDVKVGDRVRAGTSILARFS
jgi:phosphatidylserine decarboxylase